MITDFPVCSSSNASSVVNEEDPDEDLVPPNTVVSFSFTVETPTYSPVVIHSRGRCRGQGEVAGGQRQTIMETFSLSFSTERLFTLAFLKPIAVTSKYYYTGKIRRSRKLWKCLSGRGVRKFAEVIVELASETAVGDVDSHLCGLGDADGRREIDRSKCQHDRGR